MTLGPTAAPIVSAAVAAWISGFHLFPPISAAYPCPRGWGGLLQPMLLGEPVVQGHKVAYRELKVRRGTVPYREVSTYI